MAVDKNGNSDQASFPVGYEHFADMARTAAETLRGLNERIKNIPLEDIKQTTAQLKLDPPALAKAVNRWRTRDLRPALEAQKEEVERVLHERMERDIKTWDLDADTAKQIRMAAIDTLHPNHFADMPSEQLAANRLSQKDQNNSQNYMRALLAESRLVTPKPKLEKESQLQQNKKFDVDKSSFAQRYTLKLSFDRKEVNRSSVDKSKSRDVDKD